MARKTTTTNEENKALLSGKIATDTEVYLAAGGTIKHCTHLDNANSGHIKKTKREHLEETKRRGLLSIVNHKQRKQNASTKTT